MNLFKVGVGLSWAEIRGWSWAEVAKILDLFVGIEGGICNGSTKTYF